MLVMWLLGTNYQNNLILAMAFLLLSVMLVCILHTFANLSGITVRLLHAEPCFVGDTSSVELSIKASHRDHTQIQCYWDDEQTSVVSLNASQSKTIRVPVVVNKRGWFDPKRLWVKTTYPLGLLQANTRLDLNLRILAYPYPIKKLKHTVYDAPADLHGEQQHRAAVAGQEEFAGLRPYEAGDAIKHLDWRALARGQGLATRQFEDPLSEHLWLDWQSLSGLDREQRLSQLCAQALEYAEQPIRYGLRLPNTEIQPDFGDAHLARVLEKLALFEWERT